MLKDSNTTKDPKDMSMGEMFAEKAVSVLKETSKKSQQLGRKIGLKKIKSQMDKGLKLRWTCGVCKAYIDDFQDSQGVSKLKSYLKKLDNHGYIPCKSNGKKHLNRFEVEGDAVVFTTRLILKEEKPPKVKKAK